MKTHKRTRRSRTTQKRGAGFAATHGSAAHVHFEITTREGNRAMIKGDPHMPETTMRAIATMIDTLAQAINRGEVKPLNDGTQRPGSPDGSLATETRKQGSLK